MKVKQLINFMMQRQSEVGAPKYPYFPRCNSHEIRKTKLQTDARHIIIGYKRLKQKMQLTNYEDKLTSVICGEKRGH